MAGVLIVTLIIIISVTLTSKKSPINNPVVPARLPDVFPNTILNLTNWELQLPVQGGDSILMIEPDQFNNYSSQYFYVGDDFGVILWTPSNGATTIGTLDPRTELREINPDGDWFLPGTHILTGKTRVLALPSQDGIVIAQLHGEIDSTNPQLCKLIWLIDNTIIAQVKSDLDPNGPEISLNFGHYELGEIISYTLTMKDLLLNVTIVATTTQKNILSQFATFENPFWFNQTFYFKAGLYLLDHTPSNYISGTIELYDVNVIHSI